jgi:hypothetical protein
MPHSSQNLAASPRELEHEHKRLSMNSLHRELACWPQPATSTGKPIVHRLDCGNKRINLRRASASSLSIMGPEVLHLIICNLVETDPNDYHRLNIFGLITSIRSAGTPPFPLVHSELRALLVWTGGQGIGELMLRIVEDRTASTVFRSRARQVRLVGDVAAVGVVVFRIRNCVFPAAGLYWV